MDPTTLAAFRAAKDRLKAERLSLEGLLRDPDRHSVRAFRLTQGRVIAALAELEEWRALVLARDGERRPS